MKELKIKSIESAFYAEPLTKDVCIKETDHFIFTPSTPHIHTPRCIKEIRLQRNHNGDMVYAGYNFNDELLFEVISISVNVLYFTQDELKQENETK